MAAHECYHCKQWIEDGESHDCWSTTEAALTADLTEDLREAWERLRETAMDFGEQRVYASHNSIMFARRSCYFFVRPKKSFLEVCVFLGSPVNAPQVRRVDRVSRSKLVHIIPVRHRDEVEAPLTDWLREAFDFSAAVPGRTASEAATRRKPASVRAAKRGSGRTGTRKAGVSAKRGTRDQAGARPSVARRKAATPEGRKRR